MAVREILLLGNPGLLQVCEAVEESQLDGMREVVQDLEDTLFAFREHHGAGRAIAAPQIGVGKRVIYLNVGEPVALLNPEFLARSEEMFEIWDDCMSFPDLLVRVRRHETCSIRFRDLSWKERIVSVEGDLSELLQHELDHLDGILAVARAINGSSFAFRSQWHRLPGRKIARPEDTFGLGIRP